MSETEVKLVLTKCFTNTHIEAAIQHYKDAQHKFITEEWDGVALKAGKFVEAITKALMVYCGKQVSAGRDFKAGQQLQQLSQTPNGSFPDEIRIVIPKACIFIYEVVNNRGGRHDAGDIDANSMDATVVLPMMSWILAEMVRFCSASKNLISATHLIQELTSKTYPYFEEIDGRTYVNIAKLAAPDCAILLLYNAYPQRVLRSELIAAVIRHGISKNTAAMAVSRLKLFLDEEGNYLKLRMSGVQKAEALLKKFSS